MTALPAFIPPFSIPLLRVFFILSLLGEFRFIPTFLRSFPLFHIVFPFLFLFLAFSRSIIITTHHRRILYVPRAMYAPLYSRLVDDIRIISSLISNKNITKSLTITHNGTWLMQMVNWSVAFTNAGRKSVTARKRSISTTSRTGIVI